MNTAVNAVIAAPGDRTLKLPQGTNAVIRIETSNPGRASHKIGLREVVECLSAFWGEGDVAALHHPMFFHESGSPSDQ